jgi:alkanesulfonate monooxygenase SsuD/methylene tetrahydromethanopterin reductase-like flavin-dependent oxidoreductase (luciferase family)
MTAQLRFGILIEQRHGLPELLERSLRYESLGFDTVWFADCFAEPSSSEDGAWFEAWTLLAGLAAQTSMIRLGSLITHLVYRNPALLAAQAMTVDHLSNGRLELGLGSGASEQDWPMTAGVEPWPVRERVERLEEGIIIIDRLLREQRASFEGRYYRVQDARVLPGPVQRPRPRLTIAGHGPQSVKLAAKYADAWNTAGIYWKQLDQERSTAADALQLTRSLAEQLDNAAIEAGRAPSAIERSVLAGFEWPVTTARPWDSVEAFQDFVGAYRDMGFTEFICPEPGNDKQRKTLERVCTEILPELRSGGNQTGEDR